MLSYKLFYASQAKNNFYRLLKMVAAGEQIVIENKETGERFQITKAEKDSKPNLGQLLKRFIASPLIAKPPSEMKKIFESKSSIKLK